MKNTSENIIGQEGLDAANLPDHHQKAFDILKKMEEDLRKLFENGVE